MYMKIELPSVIETKNNQKKSSINKGMEIEIQLPSVIETKNKKTTKKSQVFNKGLEIESEGQVSNKI